MEFKKHQSIYLQIADLICENILTLKWPVGEKIQSVREMAANIEVNPNTVMRSYAHLQDAGIIKNKRGIGFFVSEGAPDKILELQRQEFVQEELPEVVRKMKLLGVGIEDFVQLFDQFNFKS